MPIQCTQSLPPTLGSRYPVTTNVHWTAESVLAVELSILSYCNCIAFTLRRICFTPQRPQWIVPLQPPLGVAPCVSVNYAYLEAEQIQECHMVKLEESSSFFHGLRRGKICPPLSGWTSRSEVYAKLSIFSLIDTVNPGLISLKPKINSMLSFLDSGSNPFSTAVYNPNWLYFSWRLTLFEPPRRRGRKCFMHEKCVNLVHNYL